MERYRALYVGRFQIFHNGHLAVAKSIDSQADVGEIVIAVGSSQYSRHNKHPELPYILNPFTGDERKRMLEMSLDGELSNPYRIVTIEDTHNCPKWFNFIDRAVVPEVFYTNVPKEIKLFESRGIPTRPIPKQKEGLHAHVIREMIAAKDNWQRYVPSGTQRFIREYHIEDILGRFFSEHQDEIERVREMQRRDGITPYDPKKVY